MFANRFMTSFRKPFGLAHGRERKARGQRVDIVREQVKKVLQEVDQQLILMVRG